MSKMTETLKNNGWVETTMGECQAGDEVLVLYPNYTSQPLTVARVIHEKWAVEISDGSTRRGDAPVLRSPRPEYEPGTVALITWDGQDKPMRAMRLNEDWVVVDNGYVLEGSAEVVRVLLPADQDTPAVEVTDEMVERAAEAYYRARYKEPICDGPPWDEVCEESPADVALYRWQARRFLKAALGGGES